MRAVWKGVISFGLVTIPVKLYRATEMRDVSFHQVRASDGSRIRYQRIAAADGEEVAYADIAKGFELPSGDTVVLTDADMAELPLASNRYVEVESFVPLEQVDPIYFDKSYYVEPDGQPALKPYALLRDALVASGRVGVVKVALRQREQIATLRIRDGVFLLETMIWPDEIREAEFPILDQDIEVRPQELAMATSLIESLASDFDPSGYTDAYREAVEALIQAKIEGNEVISPPGAADDGEERADVVDLMSALRASVKAAREARGVAEPDDADSGSDSGSGSGAGAKRAAPRKPAAKKASASASKTSTAQTSSATGSGSGGAVKPAAKKAKAAPRKSA